jgi:hypothetical protein
MQRELIVSFLGSHHEKCCFLVCKSVFFGISLEKF